MKKNHSFKYEIELSEKIDPSKAVTFLTMSEELKIRSCLSYKRVITMITREKLGAQLLQQLSAIGIVTEC